MERVPEIAVREYLREIMGGISGQLPPCCKLRCENRIDFLVRVVTNEQAVWRWPGVCAEHTAWLRGVYRTMRTAGLEGAAVEIELYDIRPMLRGEKAA